MISRLTPYPSPLTQNTRRTCGGFTYLGVLFAVFFIGVALAATGNVWQQTRQREKESELLFVGAQFRQALESYYETPPPGKPKKFPLTLEELLRDARHPDVRRHLRKLYLDPMTGGAEWGLLRGADHGIVGLYSRSEGEPFKKENFDLGNESLAGKQHYAEWHFVAAKGGVVEGSAPLSSATSVNAEWPESIQSSSSPDPVSREDGAQIQSPADSQPTQTSEPNPNLPRNAACQAEFLRMRTSCRASGGDCVRATLLQYTQCLK